uniref:Uncharacterized protein n=1 Tax=Rhizophora mucronata TaxID=61149 RepID=A0A2P2PCC5_RHIMU
MLQDWRNFLSLPPSLKRSSVSWRVPQNCSLDSLRHYYHSENSIQQEVQE